MARVVSKSIHLQPEEIAVAVEEEDFNLDKKPGPDFDQEKMSEITQRIMRDMEQLK